MGNKFKLGELLEVLTDYHANGAYKKLKENVELLDSPDYAVMIRTTNFEQSNFSDSLKFITKHAYDFLAKSKVYPNDIIMNKIANAGSSYLMPDLGRPVSLAMNLFLLRVDAEKVNPRYLYLFLKINEAYVKSFANGSVTKTITKEAVRNLDIELPSRLIQDKIVKQFSDINEKITINSQINQTLEQITQTLFKSWFVDFDPVKAKMNGEQPKGMDAPFLSKEVASLFPKKLVESELGLIPEGWGVGELSKLFELHRGFDLPKSKRQDGEYPVYAAGGYHGAHNEFKMEPPGIITGRSGVIGNVYLSLDKYWPLNTTLYVREFRTCGPYYAYHLLRSLDLKSLNSGSAVPSLNRNFVHSTNVCHPDSDVLAKFEEIVTPLFEKMVANNEQNKSLSELRDTLLPKLLSGEIDLENVQVEQAKALAE
ncbi:restriction endonuclease subunit S [Vibrio sp. 10N.222.52.B7]|uniref:restriction endonuclease subunit S n=1 Tax=Vibrio sp. 10N.222.52.B7 TaxID=3229629 RepID=UPI00354F9420